MTSAPGIAAGSGARSVARAKALAAVRRLPPLETSIVALAVALLAVLSAYARQPQPLPTLDSFSSYDSASGGYRAFYELLAREGAHVDRFEQHPAFLDANIDTLVWALPLPFDPRTQTPSGADVGALAAWIRAGGRLLYLTEGKLAPSVRTLGIPRTVRARNPATDTFIARQFAAAGIARLATRSGPRWHLSAQQLLLDDGRGPLVLSYALGRGTVTAVLDEGAFTNARIAGGDNARLAAFLALPRRPGAYVSFDEMLHGFVTAQHWWQIVPRPFLIAVVLAACALFIALAGAGIRLGPPLEAQGKTERAPSDFIAALAALLQRGQAYGHTLDAARASTTRVMARVLGLPEDSTPQRVLAGLDPGAQRTAYETLLETCSGRSCDERSFVRGVALAAWLRKEYAAYGRSRN